MFHDTAPGENVKPAGANSLLGPYHLPHSPVALTRIFPSKRVGPNLSYRERPGAVAKIIVSDRIIDMESSDSQGGILMIKINILSIIAGLLVVTQSGLQAIFDVTTKLTNNGHNVILIHDFHASNYVNEELKSQKNAANQLKTSTQNQRQSLITALSREKIYNNVHVLVEDTTEHYSSSEIMKQKIELELNHQFLPQETCSLDGLVALLKQSKISAQSLEFRTASTLVETGDISADLISQDLRETLHNLKSEAAELTNYPLRQELLSMLTTCQSPHYVLEEQMGIRLDASFVIKTMQQAKPGNTTVIIAGGLHCIAIAEILIRNCNYSRTCLQKNLKNFTAPPFHPAAGEHPTCSSFPKISQSSKQLLRARLSCAKEQNETIRNNDLVKTLEQANYFETASKQFDKQIALCTYQEAPLITTVGTITSLPPLLALEDKKSPIMDEVMDKLKKSPIMDKGMDKLYTGNTQQHRALPTLHSISSLRLERWNRRDDQDTRTATRPLPPQWLRPR